MLNHTNSSFVGAIPAYFVKLLFSLAVFLPVQVAHAIPVEDLYVTDVLVLDESSRQLRTGARAGLLQVLVRVSGTIDVEQSSLVRNSLRNPAAYYYQYSYESTDRVLVVNDEEVPAKLLRLHFEPSAIARLLRDANLPVWGSNRPAVLLWIAISDGTQGLIWKMPPVSALPKSGVPFSIELKLHPVVIRRIRFSVPGCDRKLTVAGVANGLTRWQVTGNPLKQSAFRQLIWPGTW
jgi:hypothetical protein